MSIYNQSIFDTVVSRHGSFVKCYINHHPFLIRKTSWPDDKKNDCFL